MILSSTNDDKVAACPRILLLTWQRPDGRYAGAEVLRKILSRLPRDQVRWAYLAQSVQTGSGIPESRGFEPRSIHWKFRNTVWRYLYTQHVQSRRLATAIARWANPFAPEVIWVLAELGALTVGFRLHRMLGIPMHATVHDAYEFSRFALPRGYYPIYFRSAMRLVRNATSFDSVSPALSSHVIGQYGGPRDRALVFPPSVSTETPATASTAGLDADGKLRRIALCGSMRILKSEWRRFLSLLAQSPFLFEICAFVEPSAFFDAPFPDNVKIQFEPYQPDEEALIRKFRTLHVHAAYLGLTRKPEQACFARYSLSSKLTAYVAAGLPVIVDGPVDSEAWRLVREYGAGILCGPDDTAALRDLASVFEVSPARERMSDGAIRLCREQFDLDRNSAQFTALLCQVAGRTAGEEPPR